MQTASNAATIRLHDRDNVVITLRALRAGETFEAKDLRAKSEIPAGHKIAVEQIAAGTPIIKYGQAIGVASQPIDAGEHVHTQNVGIAGRAMEEQTQPDEVPADIATAPRTFLGIRRPDGRAATRNYIGIVTTVNCSATVAQHIASSLTAELQGFPNVDGIVPVTHAHGCAQGSDEEGMRQLQRTLSGFIDHPNFAGVLVLGLGCETNQIARTLKAGELELSGSLQAMTIQGEGGTRSTIDNAKAQLKDMLPAANDVAREPITASELVLGLECGGSDGYSGISANPALGYAADLLVQHGGTAILSETPEIYGAEHLLLRRAVDQSVADKLRELLRWWEKYAEINGSKLDNNPSHGNKAGGLTTIYEKSLGAVAKSGSMPLVDVYKYAQRIDKRGFVFMDSPGYDPMSITGQVASGANLIAFTTGRGSVYGCKPVPSIKLATNSAMYRRMADDMDVNCGRIIDGETTLEQMGEEIFETLLAVASGKKTCSEELGFGDNEFVPWVVGAHM